MALELHIRPVMEVLDGDDLGRVTGGGEGWELAKKWGRRAFVPLRAITTLSDTRDAYNQARANGDNRFMAGLKGVGAGTETATWPLVPLAREVFTINPAH